MGVPAGTGHVSWVLIKLRRSLYRAEDPDTPLLHLLIEEMAAATTSNMRPTLNERHYFSFETQQRVLPTPRSDHCHLFLSPYCTMFILGS